MLKKDGSQFLRGIPMVNNMLVILITFCSALFADECNIANVCVEEVFPNSEFAGIKFSPLHEKQDFKLKIGDRLALQIYGEQTALQLVEIDPSGSISFSVINGFPAAGKTVSELKKSLEDELNRFYRDVTLSVTFTENLGDYYVILGEVYNPGMKPFVGNVTLLTALAEAGGTTLRQFRRRLETLADLDKAFVSRNGEYIPVDFARLIDFGDMSQNIPLQSGDYIYIPSLENPEVYVLGEVRRPTTVRYNDTITLLEALTRAHGVTLRASSRIAVIRDSICNPRKYLIDYNLIKTCCAPDFILEPGDVVFVPPRTFITAEEIYKAGVRAFVANVATWAGNRLLIQFEPGAAGLSGNSTNFNLPPVASP